MPLTGPFFAAAPRCAIRIGLTGRPARRPCAGYCRSSVDGARRAPGGSLERVYALTSLAVHQANAAVLAERVRGHWAIENREHHVRDVTFGEDASLVRDRQRTTGDGLAEKPAIGALRRAGRDNIAEGLRYHGRDMTRPLAALGLT